jgi:hypothetical protein
MYYVANFNPGLNWPYPYIVKRNIMHKVSFFVAAGSIATTLLVAIALSANKVQGSATATFSFASLGDSHEEVESFSNTVNQISSLNPAFVLFNGDLELKGVVLSEMDPMISVLKNANIFNKTFLVRGNSENHVSGSDVLWENYFSTAPNIKVLPAGVTNYVALDENSTYLTYSFDYENSRFIGMDVPGDITDNNILTTAEYSFLDARLSDAENLGLTHAFIFFHGPEYCIEQVHCNCTAKNDSSCTPPAFVNLINMHPIVSATFHGHEHILGWVHMDNTRVSTLTHPYEEFFTSPAGGGSYNAYMYPDRVDYYYPDMPSYSDTGFGLITVEGDSFTFSLYKVGITTPVWSQTFTKGILPTHTPSPTKTDTPTKTATPTWTATQTNTETQTFTPSATFTYTPSPTNTDTPTDTTTPTWTATQTDTETQTFTPSATFTYTPSPTNTDTPTDTTTPTWTATQTDTETQTFTPSATFTYTPSPTDTDTRTPTQTPTLVPTQNNVYLPLVAQWELPAHESDISTTISMFIRQFLKKLLLHRNG